MAEDEDLVDMIEILATAIAIHEKEEEFFRRSANASTRAAAKELFAQIAEDLGKYRNQLEARKGDIESTLRRLQLAGQKR
jgi:hypothetical protein